MPAALFFFCSDLSVDPVAAHVLEACRQRYPLDDGELPGTKEKALVHRSGGATIYLVQTSKVMTDALGNYLDQYELAMRQVDFAGVVNWHEGASAPQKIFSVHTNGDVVSGTFPVADAGCMAAVLCSLEHNRKQFPELSDWRTLPEATHCSGMAQNVEPKQLLRCPCPLLDIEIGSYAADWQVPAAHNAMADGLINVSSFVSDDLLPVLFVGGLHFEPSLYEATVHNPGTRVGLAHVLPNQWIQHGYEGEAGMAKIRSAAASIRGGVRAVAFHDSLRGPIKEVARALAAELGVPAINHRRLRSGQLEF